MILSGINHLAFITRDMEMTIRFYRDLLGMELVAGIGHPNYRHYFFRCGNTQVAFFEYPGASDMERKPHGAPTRAPLGFDHVSFTVDSRADLFGVKDQLEAAGFEVSDSEDDEPPAGITRFCCVPTHIVTTPYFCSLLFSSFIICTVSFAPVHPNG